MFQSKKGVCFSNISIGNVENRQKSNKKRGPNKLQGGQIFRKIPISGARFIKHLRVVF